MSNLPSNISYGTIVGQFIASVSDSADDDFNPDAKALGGTISFTPSTSVLKNASANPGPVSIVKTTIVGVLDGDGFLCTNHIDPNTNRLRRGVNLVATDDPDLNPSGWTWTVIYNLTLDGAPISDGPRVHSITVPGDSIQDLTVISPVPASNGTPMLRGEAGPEGPQGPAGPAGGESAVARVKSITGQEARPVSDFVMWLGGSMRPTNMIDGDVWFAFGETVPVAPVSITTTTFNSMVANTPFTQLFAASGAGPFNWSATGLPSGLSIDPASGSVSGSPVSVGSGTATISVAASGTSSSKQFAWTVSAAATAPVILDSPAITPMTVGATIVWTPGRTGSTPMTWGVSAGSLPSGLSINSSTGSISGTPTLGGPFSFTLQATNSVGSNTRAFSGTVAEAATPTVISVFGSSDPGPLTHYNDADTGSWLAHQFYVPASGASMQTAQIIGARLMVPSGSPAIGQTWRIALVRLTGNGIIRVGGADFGGQDVLATNGSLTQGPALVAGWNELLFSQEWPGMDNLEGVIIGAMIGDGRHYLFNTTVASTAVPSSDSRANLVLAESGVISGEATRSFYRGTPASGAVRWYGIDIMMRTSL